MSSLTITLIQTSLFWEDKKANLQMLLQKIESIKERTEVIILPEMFSTGFSMNTKSLSEEMDGETIKWMKKITSSKKVILTGSIIIHEDGKYFNRLIWMLPDGNFGYYDKRHLFAFANEDKHYTPGNKRFIASVKGWKINLLICYDLRFPVWARQSHQRNYTGKEELQQPEYDLLVYVANWPDKRIPAWKTLLQARAIENQSYVIGVNRVGTDAQNINYCGHSMMIDPMGEIIYERPNEEDVFTFTLQKEKLHEVREKLPFLKDSDEFTL